MIIDFKEIPKANKGDGDKDRFEQFACDFLETIGFTIVRRPDRGSDGEKDLIIIETRKGVGGETNIKWLVSCKHKAHSGASVYVKDEPSIQDRIAQHNCQAFMGFYSTIAASSMSNRLDALKDKFEYTIYDGTRIEKELFNCNQRDRLLKSYFPLSYEKYRKQGNLERINHDDTKKKLSEFFNEEDILRIAKTAIILIEIEKIKSELSYNDWDNIDDSLNKLYRFSDHSNEKIATTIFSFLDLISERGRANMPSKISSSLHSLVLTFFPSSYDTDIKARIANGKQCINIGFNLIYDAFIKINNFKIAEFGLSIWKYIYKEGKGDGMHVLMEEVLNNYKMLEQSLDRPERSDLENAKDMVKIFKDDLKTKSLAFPVLPDHLYELMKNDD